MNLKSREDLEKQKVRVLQKTATSLGIKGAWDMKKEDVITALLMQNNDAAKGKMHYIEHVQIGTLVAFKISDTKAKSGKVIKRSTSKRKVMVETEYGAQFVISFEDIIWVKTGGRWPRGVYQLLKGDVKIEKK